MGQMSDQDLKEMLEEMGKEGSRTSTFYKLKEGRNVIRILPPSKKNGEKLFYVRQKQHWLNRTPLNCLNQDVPSTGHKAKMDAIDKEAQKWWNAGEKGSPEWEFAKELSANESYIMRVIVRGEGEDKPQWFKCGMKIFKIIKQALTEELDQYGNIIDAFEGRDIIITREGTGITTQYTPKIAGSPSPVAADKTALVTILAAAAGMNYGMHFDMPTEEEIAEALENWKESKGLGVVKAVTKAPVTKVTEEVEDTSETIMEEPEEQESSDEAIDDALAEFL